MFVHAEPGFVVKLFPQIWDPKLAQDAEVDSYKLITHLNLEGGYYMPSLLHSGELEFVHNIVFHLITHCEGQFFREAEIRCSVLS